MVGSRFWSPPLRSKGHHTQSQLSFPCSSATPSISQGQPTHLGDFSAWSCCRKVANCGGVRSPRTAFSRIPHCGSWRL